MVQYKKYGECYCRHQGLNIELIDTLMGFVKGNENARIDFRLIQNDINTRCVEVCHFV